MANEVVTDAWPDVSSLCFSRYKIPYFRACAAAVNSFPDYYYYFSDGGEKKQIPTSTSKLIINTMGLASAASICMKECSHLECE